MRMRLFAWLLHLEAGARDAAASFLRGLEARTGRAWMDGYVTGMRCDKCRKIVNIPPPGLSPEMARMICLWSGWTHHQRLGSEVWLRDVCEKCTRASRAVQ